MTFYEISQKLDSRYKKLSAEQKSWIVIGAIVVLLLLLAGFGLALYEKFQQRRLAENYEKLLEKSRQNYYLQSLQNSNLEKKLQDMLLEIAKLKNNTIELERMFSELSDEKVSLEEIRARMEAGLKNTRTQLNNMQKSVNYLIDQRSKTLIYTKEELIREKADTHGK